MTINIVSSSSNIISYQNKYDHTKNTVQIETLQEQYDILKLINIGCKKNMQKYQCTL